MKHQANSMTLYEQFQKAQTETDSFLSAADDLSKHMAGVLGISYDTPVAPPCVKVPEMNDLQNVLSREVSGDTEGSALLPESSTGANTPGSKKKKEKGSTPKEKKKAAPFSGLKTAFSKKE